MAYTPSGLPQTSTADGQALSQWLSNELQQIASSQVSNVVSLPLTPIFKAPAKPRTGLVVYADGVKWNPGSGEGLYEFQSDGNWHFLQNSAPPAFPLGTGDFAGMSNGILSASASGGALTVSVKTFAGVDPSAGDPTYFYFRDNTLGNGDIIRLVVTSALSVVLNSGNTLGVGSGSGVRLWIGAFNAAGTVQLAAIICSNVNGIFCPKEQSKYTSVVPGNVGKVWVSTSAITTAAPWRLIGFCEWNSLTTAGTWVVPDLVQLFGPGISKPGELVGNFVQSIVNTATGTNSSSLVVTVSTINITPSSASNIIKVGAESSLRVDTANAGAYAILLRGGSAQIGVAQTARAGVGLCWFPINLQGFDLPNSASAVTYAVYIGATSGNVSWGNQSGGSALVPNTARIWAEEIMG